MYTRVDCLAAEEQAGENGINLPAVGLKQFCFHVFDFKVR
jgi:hypothetical protein